MTTLPWAAELPPSWKIVPARAMLKSVRRDPRSTDATVTAFRDGQVTLRSNRRSDGFTESVKEIGYQGVRQGEVVIHSMDAFAGAIGVSDSDGKMSPVVHIYTTPNDNPEFIVHVLRVASQAGFIRALAKGIRERSTSFDRSVLKSMLLPRPPREDQSLIVEYLDRETQKIDELIAEQRSLIETLRERRQAVIDLALEEFIWDVPLGSICDLIQTGPFGSQLKADEYVYGGVAVINPTHFTAGIIVPNPDVSVSSEVAQRLSRHALRKGDVIAARRGILGSCAVVTEFDLPAICGTGSAILRPNNTIIPEFLAHVLTTRRCRQNLELVGVGATMVSINSTMLSRLRFPRPTTEQQEAAVDKTSTDISRIDELITESEDLIALSQERRAALIAAAVTGQIDVRTTA